MGVYLPKVEMPKGDEVITVQICPDGSIWQRFRGTVPGVKAVPVPPHGRLVDADRLLSEHMKRKYYHLPNGDTAIPVIDVEHAPTVIEAEEG